MILYSHVKKLDVGIIFGEEIDKKQQRQQIKK